MEQKRDYSLDLLKIFFCILIIALHTPTALPMKYYLLICSITALAVPGFFAISGYLLFFRNQDTRKIYTKVLPRYVSVFLLWAIVYWVEIWTSLNDGWDGFLLFVFQNSEAWHLWYLKCLIEILLFYPFIKLIAERQSLMKLYTILWFVFVGVRFIFIHTFEFKWEYFRWIQIPLFELDTFIDGTTGAYYPTAMLGLVLIGGAFIAYVKRLDNPKKWNWLFGAMILFGYGVTLALGYYRSRINYTETTVGIENPLNGYLLVEVCGIIGLVLANCNVGEKAGRIISYFSSLTLGVYVVHPMIMKYARMYYDNHARVYDVLLFLGVMVSSFVIIALIRLILPKKIRNWII